MLYRTYFDKNNTIVKDSYLNGGKNPITELYHGPINFRTYNKVYSRYLLHFDESEIKSKVDSGEICDPSKLTHELVLFNTISNNQNLEGGYDVSGKKRASSFDLVLYKLKQDFDEGVGYDYSGKIIDGTYLRQPMASYGNQNFYESTFNKCESTNPSNWFNSQSLNLWDIPGTTSGDPNDIIATIHFDHGSEDIRVDISQYVNDIILSGGNHGLCLAFSSEIEESVVEQFYQVNFFTRHTKSIFEPFLESKYDDVIRDSRNNFYFNKTNRLYLYSNGLIDNPTVEIHDGDGNVILTIPSDEVHCVGGGIYYVDVTLPEPDGFETDSCGVYKDVWKDFSSDCYTGREITFVFQPKSCVDYYNAADFLGKGTSEYTTKLSGIKHLEKIKRGDKRKVNVNIKEAYTTNVPVDLEDIQYRLFVQEGKNEINVIDWQPVNMTPTQNYFVIDTAMLIPNVYYLDIKTKNKFDVKTLNRMVSFSVVNQVIES